MSSGSRKQAYDMNKKQVVKDKNGDPDAAAHKEMEKPMMKMM